MTNYGKIVDWCYDEDNDAYTPLDNFLMLLNDYLSDEETNKIYDTIAEGMKKDGFLD